MKKILTNIQQWANKHETFVEDIKAMYTIGNEPALDALAGYNDTTQGFQELLKEAIATNTPLRALGGGWSWTKIATANNGIMMDTKPLNTIFTISTTSVLPTYIGDTNKLIFAQCGNGIWELSKFLRGKNLSLKTSGASNGQTIAGALATGTHGSSIDIGAVPDYVVGLHIIVSPTKHIYLERKSAPIVSDSFIQKFNTELVQDDDLFNAALVSFGSFGIVHGIMIEADDLFLLETYMQRMPYDDVLKNLMSTLDFSTANLPCGSERPYHFSVMLNPYDSSNLAYVNSFYKRPFTTNYTLAPRVGDSLGPGDDAPCFIGTLTDILPISVPTIVNKLLAGVLIPFAKVMGTFGEIFDNTTLHGKLMSAAIGLPLDQVVKATELLIELNKTDGPFPGLFGYRFVKKTSATLGFTHFDFTCILELDGVFCDESTNFYTAAWAKLEEENIPFAFHWGKMNEYTPDRITTMYGANKDAWIEARNKLLDADGLKIFTNPILQQWGLDNLLV